jgi:hypothetical protein
MTSQSPLLSPGELLWPSEAHPIRTELWWCQDLTTIDMEAVVGVGVPPHVSRSIAEIGVLAGLADRQEQALAVGRRGRPKARALNVYPIASITDIEVATLLGLIREPAGTNRRTRGDDR